MSDFTPPHNSTTPPYLFLAFVFRHHSCLDLQITKTHIKKFSKLNATTRTTRRASSTQQQPQQPLYTRTISHMAGGKGKSHGGKAGPGGGKAHADGAKVQQSHSAKAGLQVRMTLFRARRVERGELRGCDALRRSERRTTRPSQLRPWRLRPREIDRGCVYDGLCWGYETKPVMGVGTMRTGKAVAAMTMGRAHEQRRSRLQGTRGSQPLRTGQRRAWCDTPQSIPVAARLYFVILPRPGRPAVFALSSSQFRLRGVHTVHR